MRILLALSLGLGLGILHSLGEGQTLASSPAIIEPVGVLWVNSIRMTVVPLIVALLITSIAGDQKSGMIAKLGGKTIGLFVIMIADMFITATNVTASVTAAAIVSREDRKR